MLQHEINLLRRNHLRSYDKIAFILTIFIIHDDYELTISKVLQCLFYSIDFHNS